MGWSRRAVLDGSGTNDITTVSIAIETNILLHNAQLFSLFILVRHLHNDIHGQHSLHLHGMALIPINSTESLHECKLRTGYCRRSLKTLLACTPPLACHT